MVADLEEIRKRLANLGRTNLYFFCKGILGYRKLTPDLHRELCWVVESESFDKKLVMIPRGMFKTTIANIGRSLQKLIQDQSNRIIIACNTDRIAESRLRIIKGHIERNQLFRWLYPEIMPSREKWTSHEILIERKGDFADPSIAIVGVGSALAGRHCTTFIKDDIVDDKNTNTPELIQATIEWDASTIPIFDVPESGEAEEVVIGTPWTNQDVYAVKKMDPDYAVYVRHALENEKGEPDYATGKPIFPDRFPRERLEKIRARISNDDLFFCQYMCDPHGGGSADFKREYIHYYDQAPGELEISITLDPGGLKNMETSDFSAFAVVGVDVRNDWYVLETVRRRMNPREIIEEMFRLYDVYKPHTIGIEMVAWQRSLHYFAIEEMRKTGKFLPIRELRTDTRISKPMRIRGLIPRFSAGTLFIKKEMKDLEDEIFQRVRNDDLIDALAYQLQVANIAPAPKLTIIKDPFSWDSIWEELQKKHNFGSLAFDRHLADSYVESFMLKSQLKEDSNA